MEAVEELNESPAQKAVGKVLRMKGFDYIMGIIILFNMVVIIIETDESAASDDPVSTWIPIAGWSILVIFIIELIARLFLYRYHFFRDEWNVFDFVIVVTDFVFSVCGLIFGSVFPVSTLRVFRLSKLARISKVFRVFPELRLMMAGLIGSMRAIFWGMILLTFILLVWAIVAVQFIHPLNKELPEMGAYRQCERCHRAYASVFEATLTFSQQIVAGDSWGEASIPLIEHHPWTAFYFMGVFLTVGMAVLNLILGVVVNVAQRAHDDLKVEMEDEERMKKMETHNHLLGICKDLDKDDSGQLSKEELEQGFREREDFRNSFIEMDLQEEDLEIVWTILDSDRSGTVSYSEFVSQIYKLRNSDTQFMLAYIKYYITIIKNSISDQMVRQQEEILQANEKVEEEIEKVEAEEKIVLRELRDMAGDMAGIPKKEASRDLEKEVKSVEEKAQESAKRQPLQDAAVAEPIAARYVEANSPAQASDAKVVPAAEVASGSLEMKVQQKDSEVEAGGLQIGKDILKEVDDSRQFQAELRETIKDIKQSLDFHTSNTSKLLMELLPVRQPRAPDDDLVPSPVTPLCTTPRYGCSPVPSCCKQGSVQRVMASQNDLIANTAAAASRRPQKV